jgi:hypothetical protein
MRREPQMSANALVGRSGVGVRAGRRRLLPRPRVRLLDGNLGIMLIVFGRRRSARQNLHGRPRRTQEGALRSSLRCPSGVEIGNQLAFQLRNLILEQQLTFLEPAQLYFVYVEIELETRDHVVQITMFNPELTQALEVTKCIRLDVVTPFVHQGGRPDASRRGLSAL